MSRYSPLHPFAFGLYPVLALLAGNSGEAQLADAGRSLVAALMLAALALVAGRLLLRDWSKGAALATASLILFHGYGHVYRVIEGVSWGGVLIGRHRTLLAISLILLAGIAVWLSRRALSSQVTVALNLSGALLLAMPAFQIGRFEIRNWGQTRDRQTGLDAQTLSLTTGGPAGSPDIYYIILDEYARADVLQDVYAFDNRDFISFLESRGFSVFDRSRANYAQTELSLAALLNLDYIQALSPDLTAREGDRSPLSVLMRQNVVRQSLEAAGYRTVAFPTGFGWSEWTDADWYLEPTLSSLDRARYLGVYNPFEGMLLANSMAVVAVEAVQRTGADLEFPYRMHRATALNTLERLGDDVPGLPGPKLVFAHVIAPHGPWVFDADGNPARNPDPVVGYRDEVVFLNGMLSRVVDRILQLSEVPPVIILQADTGPGVGLRWEEPPSGETLWARMTIFNAICLPGGDAADVSNELSSVNTFRLVFNQVFDVDLGLLPNRSYFSVWDYPYDFQDVTDEVRDYLGGRAPEVAP